MSAVQVHLKNAFLVFGALFISIMSMRFLSFERQSILLGKSDELWNSAWYPFLFFTHVIGGIIALVTGPPQFFTRLRQRYLGFHRQLGKLYVLAILCSGIAGLIIAPYAMGGWISQSGFFCLSILWLSFTYKAYATIKRGQVEEHRRWMMRSYALTFGAVTLRLGLLLAAMGLVDFILIYRTMSWMCWIINWAIVEWVLSRQMALAR